MDQPTGSPGAGPPSLHRLRHGTTRADAIWRIALTLAAVLHALLVASIVTQPLDPEVPPELPRALVWRCCYDAVTWPGPGVDFFALYHSGVQVRRGVSPYVQDETPRTTPYYFRYLYSPALAYTFGQWISRLPPETAYRLWAVSIELSLLLFLWTWWRSSVDTVTRRVGTLLLLLSTPYFLEIHVGQFTFVAAAACATAVMLPSARRFFRIFSGSLYFFGVFLKLFPLAAVPAMVARPLGPPVVGAVIALAVLAAGAALHPDASLELLRLNATDDTTRPHPGHISLLHVVRVALAAAGLSMAPEVWKALAPATLLVGMAVAMLAVRRWRLDAVDGVVLLLLTFLLLFSRAAEHHWSAVLLLASLGLSRAPLEALSPLEILVARACLVMVAGPTIFVLLPTDAANWSTSATLLLPALKVAPGLFLFCLLVKAARNVRRPLS